MKINLFKSLICALIGHDMRTIYDLFGYHDKLRCSRCMAEA